MKNKYQICSNCVMDTTDSKILFDSKGVCDHCQTFHEKISPNWDTSEKGEKKLIKLLEQIKKEGKNKDFDCIMGMSGGIDSSYLLYVMKEKYNLRPLVFHVDAGWNSQIAVNNIERLIDGLDLDLYTDVIDWEEIKDLQLSFFKSGVSHIDTPQDHAFFATMYNFASKHKIKYILTGANYSTECIRNPLEWMYFQSDSIQLKDIHKNFGNQSLKNYPITNILWHKIYDCVISFYNSILQRTFSSSFYCFNVHISYIPIKQSLVNSPSLSSNKLVEPSTRLISKYLCTASTIISCFYFGTIFCSHKSSIHVNVDENNQLPNRENLQIHICLLIYHTNSFGRPMSPLSMF